MSRRSNGAATGGGVTVKRLARLLVVPAALALVAGCGGSKLGRVKGRITCNGKPFYPSAIVFSPVPAGEADRESGKAAWGSPDEQGRYVLTTYSHGDGALIGKHRVTINVEYPERPYPCKGYDRKTIYFEVKPGENEIDIRLEEFQK
jgi:hypothetical protein